ncbi:MAG: hypothetical protein FWD13_08335 [Treponema sp.]|nr:hypothetical protein [Treponema sp.]
MKKLNVLIIVIFLFILLAGCNTTTPAAYTFVENTFDDNTATITFVHNRSNGVLLINYDGTRLPAPEIKERWEPITFPAGRALNLRVNVYNEANLNSSGDLLIDIILLPLLYSRKMDINIDFQCPPLEQGKNYRLSLRTFTFGKGSLVLTDTSTRRVVYQQRL